MIWIRILMVFLISGVLSRCLVALVYIWVARNNERMRSRIEIAPLVYSMDALERWTWEWFASGPILLPPLMLVWAMIVILHIKWAIKRPQKST